MSNILRDSESLGKSNGKKWSNIWTFLFGSGLKSPRKKKFFFCCWFCLNPPSYGIGATIRIGREMLCLLYAGFFFFSLWPLYGMSLGKLLDLRDNPKLHHKKPLWLYLFLVKLSSSVVKPPYRVITLKQFSPRMGKKSCIRETKHLSTDADCSTNSQKSG